MKKFIFVLIAVVPTAIRASAAHAALSCYPTPRFTVTSEGTAVADGKTGLVWQRGMAPEPKTWEDAAAYCAALGAGYRLPSVRELVTIIDTTRTNPAIDTTAFPDTASSDFWSSTSAATFRWYVGFSSGSTEAYLTSTKNRVRCVR